MIYVWMGWICLCESDLNDKFEWTNNVSRPKL